MAQVVEAGLRSTVPALLHRPGVLVRVVLVVVHDPLSAAAHLDVHPCVHLRRHAVVRWLGLGVGESILDEAVLGESTDGL